MLSCSTYLIAPVRGITKRYQPKPHQPRPATGKVLAGAILFYSQLRFSLFAQFDDPDGAVIFRHIVDRLEDAAFVPRKGLSHVVQRLVSCLVDVRDDIDDLYDVSSNTGVSAKTLSRIEIEVLEMMNYELYPRNFLATRCR